MANKSQRPAKIERRDSRRRSIERLLSSDKASDAIKQTVGDILDENAELALQIRDLESARSMDPRKIRAAIFQLAEKTPEPPAWLVTAKPPKKGPGVPTLFASDWHWGEVVQPSQIGGVNEYSIKIAHERAKRLINNAMDLLDNHMVNPNYPGIVFALGGDMVSGNIHEELAKTNELEIMPTVLDVAGVLVWCIKTLADRYGRVFVPCVTGNHGRDTYKIQMKNRNNTSFDWLIYCICEKFLAGDKRVSFHIPDGSDAYYRVYDHRFLLTHGDQFRGGDGVIGALGPIIRGDHRKRSRNSQINMEYDTMLLGHWHQYIHMQRIIINGSSKGYDEYAYNNNFPFERPRQALFINHPDHGITFAMPVNVDAKIVKKHLDWVSILK